MNTCKKVCKECPFSPSALPGYLGPHTMQDIFDYKNTDYPFTCHMQRSDNLNYNTPDNIDVCKGYIIWTVKSAHQFKDPELRALQLSMTKENLEEGIGMVEFYNKHKQ